MNYEIANKITTNRIIRRYRESTLSLYEIGIFVGFFLIFFSRLFSNKLAILNFIHYPYFLILFLLSMFLEKKKHYERKVIFVFFLFFAICFSALINGFGNGLNSILEFLLICEPFLIACCLFSISRKKASFICRKTLFSVDLCTIIFSFFQFFVLGYRNDSVKGIFLSMGAGHHINGAICIITIIYCFFLLNFEKKTKNQKTIFRLTVLILANCAVVVFCDNKQSILVLLASLIIAWIILNHRLKNVVKFLFYFLFACIILYVAANTFFPALLAWANVSKINYGLESKFAVFRLIFENGGISNFLFGFGPGYSVGRLAEIMPNYPFLYSLGGKSSLFTSKLWEMQEANWVTNSVTGSSLFSMFFSFSGIFGDLGAVGLVIYLEAIFVFFFDSHHLSFIKLVFFFFFILHGIVFQWLEEPAFTTFWLISLFLVNEKNKKSILVLAKEPK
jgi:hypothetical protein